MKEPVLFKDITYPRTVRLQPFTELQAPGSFEIVAADDADDEYVLMQTLPADAKAASRVQIRAGRNAKVRLFVIQDGAEVSHLEINGIFEAEGGEIEIRGLQNTKGRQKHLISVNVNHTKSHTKSDLKVWCVGRDQGHSIFNGTMTISPGAKHVEAYQRNKNLMLSNRCVMDTFPKLFIANDEVKAAHGASVSTLEIDQLTYLQSRGISRLEAETMVTRGFVHQVLDQIRSEPVRRQVEAVLNVQEEE